MERLTKQNFIKTSKGFSLIEVMVSLLIGLILSATVLGIIANSEGQKRTTTSVDDTLQSGQLALDQIDKLVRNAGSGFAQGWSNSYGCKLDVSLNGTNILPTATALPAPFENLPAYIGSFKLAPVVIVQNESQTGSDLLIVMSGSAGYDEVPTTMSNTPASNLLNLSNTIGYQPNDLLLVNTRTDGAAPSPCLVEQVSPTYSSSTVAQSQLPLGGAYYTATGADTSLSNSMYSGGYVQGLGNMGTGTTAANPPSFVVIGTGTNGDDNILYSYDLFQFNGITTPVAISEDVVAMHAVYGIDTVGNDQVTAWVYPTGAYDASVLLNGTAASATVLKTIKAIDVGLVLRTNLLEKVNANTGEPVSPATLSPPLFENLGIASYSVNVTNQNYRYRVIEEVIPIRNSLFTQ